MTDQTARKLRICHVVATSEGGFWVYDQLRMMREVYGFEVEAIVPADHGRLIDRLREAGIPFHVTNMQFMGVRNLYRMPWNVLAMARLFRRGRYDVVQSHLFTATMICRVAAWLSDVPARFTMYPSPFPLEAGMTRWLDLETAWMESALIPSCEATHNLLTEAGVPESRLETVYYGPDENLFSAADAQPAGIRDEFGWPADCNIVCTISIFYGELPPRTWVPKRFHGVAVKGHEEFIRAAAIVRQRFPDTKFLIVGSGWVFPPGKAYFEKMKALAHELGLDDAMAFTGWRNNIRDTYAEVTVAVQASLYENLGSSVEALLMERPMVATRIGGLPDSVVDGKTGLLCRPGDPDDLARAICELLADPERARALGVAGRAHMRSRFVLQRAVPQLHSLYMRETENGARRGYRPLVTISRLIVGGAFCLGLAIGFVVRDVFGLWPRYEKPDRG